MNQRKGITPIVATVVLLLIAVAIAGAAYTYITGYWGGLTQKSLEATSATCTSAGMVINLRNSGTGNITLNGTNADVVVTKQVISGNALSGTSLSYAPTTFMAAANGWSVVLTPGMGGSITDANCNSASHGGSTCSYTIIAGGRPTVQQTTC